MRRPQPAGKPAGREPALKKRLKDLEISLAEAEDTLRAIREGEVDAVVVSGENGEQVYSLVGADSIYRLIVETMKDAAFTLAFDGTILFSNAQFGAFVGKPLDEVVGRALKEFVARDSQEEAASLLGATAEHTVRKRVVFLAADGTHVPAHVAASLLRQPDDVSICVVATDLTELENSTTLIQNLRRHEDALQRANEELAAAQEELTTQNETLRVSTEQLEQARSYYRHLVEGSGSVIVLADRDLNITFMNQYGLEFFGYSEEEIIGRPAVGTIVPLKDEEGRDLAGMTEDLRRHPDKYTTNVHQNRRKDGSLVWMSWANRAIVDKAGATAEILAIGNDLTALKKAEEQLLRLNRTLRALGRGNQALMRATDERALLQEICRIIVEDCGHAMVWIGYAEDDREKSVRPVAWSGFEDGYLETLKTSWADTERGHGPTGTAIRTGKPAFCRNLLAEPPFAPWREEALKRGYAASLALPLNAPVSARTLGAITIHFREPDPFSEDEIRLLAELADDLSQGICAIRLREQERQAQEAVKKSAEDLARSNRDLEAFAYAAGHDLQEPLRVISLYLDLLRKKCSDRLDESAGEYVRTAIESSERMSRMIRDLLEYSRVDRKGRKLEPVETADTLRNALEALRVSIEEAGAVVTHDVLPRVKCESIRIQQLFQNLVGNAIKFRQEGRPPRVHVSAERQENAWRFTVRDNGIGIPDAHHEAVFQLFRRLHSEMDYPGTGVGLALCKKIVEHHGGRIWVESQQGEGSTFCFELPD